MNAREFCNGHDDTVLCVRVDSGEEVVGKVKVINDDTISIQAPMRCVIQQGPNGQLNISFMPWLICGKDISHTVVASISKFICSYVPSEQVEQSWLQSQSVLDLSATTSKSLLRS